MKTAYFSFLILTNPQLVSPGNPGLRCVGEATLPGLPC